MFYDGSFLLRRKHIDGLWGGTRCGGCLTLLEKLSIFFWRLIIVLHGVPPPTKQKRATVRESEREAKDIIRQMMQPTAILSSDFQIFNT